MEQVIKTSGKVLSPCRLSRSVWGNVSYMVLVVLWRSPGWWDWHFLSQRGTKEIFYIGLLHQGSLKFKVCDSHPGTKTSFFPLFPTADGPIKMESLESFSLYVHHLRSSMTWYPCVMQDLRATVSQQYVCAVTYMYTTSTHMTLWRHAINSSWLVIQHITVSIK